MARRLHHRVQLLRQGRPLHLRRRRKTLGLQSPYRVPHLRPRLGHRGPGPVHRRRRRPHPQIRRDQGRTPRPADADASQDRQLGRGVVHLGAPPEPSSGPAATAAVIETIDHEEDDEESYRERGEENSAAKTNNSNNKAHATPPVNRTLAAATIYVDAVEDVACLTF